MFLVHATAHAGCSGWVIFFWEIDDEGAHSDSCSSDADGVLNSFASDASWINDAGFLEVNETFGWFHDINALPVFGGLDLSEESLAIETSIFHN